MFGSIEKKPDESSSLEDPTTSEDRVSGIPARVESDRLGPKASTLSRFLFVLAHIALKHLVYVESCVRKVRKVRADKEKAAADAAADLQASGDLSASQEASIKSKVGTYISYINLFALPVYFQQLLCGKYELSDFLWLSLLCLDL